ncbi:MAG: hypothetical protein K0R38_1450 [Polyangiaceae bacterium]|jgi:uncharacterized membrane protein|nr:hypothetical protein [Polyangiaceae bacterium]
MSFRPFSLLEVVAALGSGLIAGVFFAFSSFVLPALARLPAAHGISAMQSINVVVLNRSFLGVFLGTAACSIVLALRATADSSTSARLALAGSLFYLVGCVVVTRVGNIPYNDALMRLAPDTPQAAALWERFVARWSVCNHVRGVASFLACTLFILSLCGCSRFGVCATPDRSRLDLLPNKLSETGEDRPEVRDGRKSFALGLSAIQLSRETEPGLLRLRDLAGELGAVEDTAAYRTAQGTAFEPGAPDASLLVELMSRRGFLLQIPPLGTERIDAAAVSAVRGWILGLR